MLYNQTHLSITRGVPLCEPEPRFGHLPMNHRLVLNISVSCGMQSTHATKILCENLLRSKFAFGICDSFAGSSLLVPGKYEVVHAVLYSFATRALLRY